MLTLTRLLILACLLLLPGQGWAAWAKVQQKEIANFATCSPSCSGTFDASTTTNNLVVMMVMWQSETSTLTCSGTAGTGWSLIAGSLKRITGSGYSTQLCYALGNGNTGLTVTPSVGSFNMSAVAFEYSGNATTSIVDQSTSAMGGPGTNVTAGNLTPDTSGELLVALGVNYNGAAGAWTKATGWTAVQATVGAYLAFADYQGYNSTSATEFYLTYDSSISWAISAASFRPAAAAASSFRGMMLTGAGE